MLFCCLWRNVETSCHKHFVVFSRNQHRRLLPATCHNLRDGRPGPPATAFTTPGPIAALTQPVKPDIGSGSRFLPTPPAFDTPVRGVPVGILLCCLAREKKPEGVATRRWKKFENMFIRFYMIHERDRDTRAHTDRHTTHDSTGRAYIASRGKNHHIHRRRHLFRTSKKRVSPKG